MNENMTVRQDDAGSISIAVWADDLHDDQIMEIDHNTYVPDVPPIAMVTFYDIDEHHPELRISTLRKIADMLDDNRREGLEHMKRTGSNTVPPPD